MSEQQVTESVRALYEQYPFPAPVSSAQPPALVGWCNYTYLYYNAMHEWRDCRGRAILDAGCGTGETLWPAFVNNPGASLVGCDLSEASLRLAREKLDAIGAQDVRLVRADLADLSPLHDERFDLVFCTGVLHHLADPLKGLRSLAGRLKRDGILVMMLYATDVRVEIVRAQRILSLLCGADALPKKVETARRFFAALPHGHALRDPQRIGVDPAYVENDAHLIDTFFHPRELTYTVDGIFDLLDAADLELVRFFNEDDFDLGPLLSDPELRRKAMFMSRRAKYQLADLIAPRGDFSFIVRHKGHRPERRPRKTDDLVPVLSPVAVRIDRTPLAGGLAEQSTIEVAGFTQRRYRLDDETRRVLDLCDGTRTVAHIGPLVEGLEARGIVLYRRPLDRGDP